MELRFHVKGIKLEGNVPHINPYIYNGTVGEERF